MISRIRRLIHRWICPPVPVPQGPFGTVLLYGVDGVIVMHPTVRFSAPESLIEGGVWRGITLKAMVEFDAPTTVGRVVAAVDGVAGAVGGGQEAKPISFAAGDVLVVTLAGLITEWSM